MPKIIGEVKERILQSAKQKILEKGYKALSLRSVATECGIAVGTIYNYFGSKDDLIAAVMEEDWNKALKQMDENCQSAKDIREGFMGIYESIHDFCNIYKSVWYQYSSPKAFNVASERHSHLLNQICERILFLLKRFDYEKDIEIAPLLAEMLLSVVMRSEMNFHQMDVIIQRIFQ